MPWAPAKAGISVLNSAAKSTARANPFAATTPSKQQAPRPQSSLFAPQLSSRNTGAAFRNPAFVTLRDQGPAFSDTSGAEDSPALSDNSNWPNDTPEEDRMAGILLTSPKSPTRIDKGSRYGRVSAPFRKQLSGRGELKSHRDYSAADRARKRTRHNLDKDVSSVVRYQVPGWDESESDDTVEVAARGDPKQAKAQTEPRGLLESLFYFMDRYPNAPAHVWNWFCLVLSVSLGLLTVFIVTSTLWTVQHDIRSAHEAERMRLLSQITECQNQYTINECSKKDRPALKAMCDEWYDCMMQNPESIMKVKNLAKHSGEIVNEFFNVLNFKALVSRKDIFRQSSEVTRLRQITLAALVAISLFMWRSSNTAVAYTGVRRSPTQQAPDGSSSSYGYGPQSLGGRWRRGLLQDETDTDSSPPKMMPLLPPCTPVGRRSPSKGDRSRSPSKRSPSKSSGAYY